MEVREGGMGVPDIAAAVDAAELLLEAADAVADATTFVDWNCAGATEVRRASFVSAIRTGCS